MAQLNGNSATGGSIKTVVEDGFLYNVHTFTSSDVFEPNGDFNVEYLVVAGGGAGGRGDSAHAGGGGGAGGLLQGSTTLAANTYVVSIGAGNSEDSAQIRGNNSVVLPIDFKGHSFVFDGSGDYLTVPSNSAFLVGTGDFTLEAWVNPSLAPGGGVTFDLTIFGSFAFTPGFYFSLDNASLAPKFFNGTTTSVSSISCIADQWSHVAFTRSGSTLRIFVNGQLGHTSTGYTTNWTVANTSFIGKSNADATRNFFGSISNLRFVKGTAVYTENFTPSTVPLTAISGTSLLTAQSLSFTDASTNNFTITVFGNTTQSYLTPFTSIILSATGGGNGGSTVAAATTGFSGGSGGGGSGSSLSSFAGGAGTTGQGSAGGSGVGLYQAGGGGGADSVGANGVADVSAGAGGNGLAIDITGTTKYYAAGGGGSSGALYSPGAGGSGIGGSGSSGNTLATNGNANTGSGGGGAGEINSTTGSVAFITPGTYTWNAPPDVTSVSVVCVGGGGGGVHRSGAGGVGGGGGGLGWKNNIPVTPGQSYTVVVGAGGARVTVSAGTAGSGGASYFINTATVAGLGGAGGSNQTGGVGGGFVGDGGGNGGSSPNYTSTVDATGGGGAGGYSGNGGNAGAANTAGQAGSGGGGGGGGAGGSDDFAGGGGGVGLLGQGANGTGGAYTDANGGRGGGGSGGDGGGGTISGGGAYGGGGGGSELANEHGSGGGGAVRIVWGEGSSFPSTNVSTAFNATPLRSAAGSGGSGIVVIKYAIGQDIEQDAISIGNTATGGIVTSVVDNSIIYNVHTFFSSGVFAPAGNFSVDYLIVAGGGSGGSYVGGGGGAGGVQFGNTSITAGNYTVFVGAGAPGQGSNIEATAVTGTDGQSSSALGLSPVTGGGGGGVYSQGAGRLGGSGGGAGGFEAGTGTGGAVILGEGNVGGNTVGPRTGGAFTGGAGGGGAGAAGGNSSTAIARGGDGGAGIVSNILGTAYYWAGGGGGGNYLNGTRPGNGGIGGGGGGSSNSANIAGYGGSTAIDNTSGGNGSPIGDPTNFGGNGAANSGGGGGGVGHYGLSGNGGSGVVIIRYEAAYNEIVLFKLVAAVTLSAFDSNLGVTPITFIGGYNATYSISPALPPGLTFNSATGTISGTPAIGSTKVTNKLFTVTVRSNGVANDAVTETFTLTTVTTRLVISTVLVPVVIFNKFSLNASVIPISFSGGFGSYIYTISPALPEGVIINRFTGAISGQPVEQTSAVYEITETDLFGNTGVGEFTLTTVAELPEINATGGTESVITIGTSEYKLHLFTTSGVFNVTESNSRFVEYFVVAGGGGGGSDMGGGGGAGGYILSQTNLPNGQYTITVGAGGTGGPAGTDQVRGNSGAASAIASAGYKGYSFVFDGTGDYLSLPGSASFSIATSTTPFTIESWIYPTAAGGCVFSEQYTGVGNSIVVSISMSSTGGADSTNGRIIAFGWYIGSAWVTAAKSSIEVPLNTWSHVATVFTGSTTKVFINGNDVTAPSSPTPATTWGVVATAGNNWFIGQRWDTSTAPWFSGYISNLRYVVGTAVYTTAFTPPTAPLTAISGTSLLTAQDLSFTDNSTNNFTLTAFGNVTQGYFTPFSSSIILNAIGGGGGASDHTAPSAASAAAIGGSGGGASGQNSNNAAGTPGQGNAGAASIGQWYPGGGGGAGAAGSVNPANGGAGIENNFLGINYYWAGGGAGAGYTGNPGNGGLGGGGGGAPRQASAGFGDTNGINPGQDAAVGTLVAQTNVPGGAGGTNTGGGGGGGSHFNSNNFGGTGGSGIVAIRYLLTLPELRAETRATNITLNKFEEVNIRPVAAIDGNQPWVYSISPALPQGLIFNTATGVITGAPTVNTNGFKTFTVSITDDTLAIVSSSFILSTSTGYLNAIDLVVNSTLSIEVIKGIPDDERSTSEIIPYNTTVLVNDFATAKNLYFGNTQTITVFSSSSDFNYTTTMSTTSVEHSFHNYVSLNNQLQQNFGSATVGVTGFVLDEQQYSTPGSYTWTVPAGVTAISAVAIGGGGGGSQKITGGTGGTGGSLQYVNQIPVTPGDEYTVVIGSGGTTGGAQGNNGGTTYLMNNTTKEVVLLAPGGTGGDSMYWETPNIFFEISDFSQVIDLRAVDPQGRNLTYSVSAGSLPAGFNLNASTGKLNYTVQNLTEDITYPVFTLSAAVTGQTITRTVVLKVNSI